MQFVLLIYHGTTPIPTSKEAWTTLSADEQKATYAAYKAVNQTAGVQPGPPLGLPEAATTVRVENSQIVTSKGPYLSAREAVGGYLVFEAEDLDAAIMLASQIPPARLGGAIEIRPCAQYW